MKAGLARVNYDPRYIHPNVNYNNNSNSSSMKSSVLLSTNGGGGVLKPLDSMQARLKVARQIYTNPERKIQEQLQHKAREHFKQTIEELKNGNSETSGNTSQQQRAAEKPTTYQHTSGTADCENTEVIDLKTGNQITMSSKETPKETDNATSLKPIYSKEAPSVSQSAVQQLMRPVLSPVRSSNLINFCKSPSGDTRTTNRQTTGLLASVGGSCALTVQRSKTTVPSTDGRTQFCVDLERQARNEAERAMRDKKVFTVVGPYPSLRAALRKRGWVEKINSATAALNPETIRQSTGVKTRDEGTVVTMMSHFVRNCTPTLLFAVKATDVGSKVTKSTQLVNHFGKASTFTTKAGLCHNLRSVPWFKDIDPNTFYPRCYNLGDAEEKDAFFEDYRLTACMSFIKYFVSKYESQVRSSSPLHSPTSQCKSSRHGTPTSQHKVLDANARRKSLSAVMPPVSRNLTKLTMSRHTTSAILAANPATLDDIMCDSDGSPISSRRGSIRRGSSDSVADKVLLLPVTDDKFQSQSANSNNNSTVANFKGKRLSARSLEIAVEQCQKYLMYMEHGDLDSPEQLDTLTSSQWEQYLVACSQFISNEIEMDKKALHLMSDCKQLLEKLQKIWPQFELDGWSNVWIFKPGAKSRGRGIQCTNKLNDINEAIATSDCALVAQKYIERPFLIYKTKFDIRQWFLVTDWNPLTVWFYGACYLRFCSQEYTLNSFHVSIHLSNNSVQKYYTSAPTRSDKLPSDNMWTSDEFETYLRSEGHGEVWSRNIIPGMKQAILCVLLCTQDQVEHRKMAFELYGADFMITEDLRPWLIEINSSPSMARTTRATAELVDEVLEDTVKVVLDRKQDRNCDTGMFELIYRQQPIADPPQPDISLTVEGRRIKRQLNGTP